MVTITTVGLTATAKLLNGTDSIDPFTYLALGSGETAEAAGQTALVTETAADGFERAAATCTVTDQTTSWVHEFTNTGAGALTVWEVGIFNAAAVGTMLLRHKFTTSRVIQVGDALRVTVTDVHSEV